MKAQIKETKPEFTPVTLEITFESREELIAMWHRMNISPFKVGDSTNSYYKFNHPKDLIVSQKIFNLINNEL